MKNVNLRTVAALLQAAQLLLEEAERLLTLDVEAQGQESLADLGRINGAKMTIVNAVHSVKVTQERLVVEK